MRRDLLPVVLDAEFREKVASGWNMEVYCRDVHRSQNGIWTGNWQFAYVSPDGEEKRLLVIRRDIKPREWLTANGVLSFIADNGFACGSIPLKVGASVELGPEQRTAPPTSED